ncbi:AraC family transcriptional regulator [Porphyromonas pogonae]|uniref:helix-turn-helix domain-containing protein n=1 Tax=Porphyromonas pogonae TaxID=867595 RepID=UPI002E7612DD|nr:AraC family transcriptional regulator [Porphyromonas pogonae]
MKIIDLQKHLLCSCYTCSPRNGFYVVNMSPDDSKVNSPDITVNRIIYILKGRISVQYNLFPELTVEPRHIFFIPAGDTVYITPLDDVTMVIMKSEQIQSICSKVTMSHLSISLSKSKENTLYTFKAYQSPRIINIFYYVLSEYLLSGFKCARLHSIKSEELMMLLGISFREQELIDLFRPIIGKSAEFKQQIFRCIDEQESISTLARKMNMGIDNFKKKFKKEFGTSPYQWLLQRKAHKVMVALCESDIPIKQIVDAFKFSSRSHFNKFCEHWLGASPGSIRKKHGNH